MQQRCLQPLSRFDGLILETTLNRDLDPPVRRLFIIACLLLFLIRNLHHDLVPQPFVDLGTPSSSFINVSFEKYFLRQDTTSVFLFS